MPEKSRIRRYLRVNRSHPTQKSSRKEPSDVPAELEGRSPTATLKRPNAANILQLQAMVGNQAVRQYLAGRPGASLMQRDGEGAEADANPLTARQAASALSYYQSQPRLYSPQIIMQIQGAVGTTPSGTMTNEDVQAVAKWQQKLNASETPTLKIDGKAGPRTLPTLFRTGLADQGAITSYSGKAHDLLAKWDELGTAEARINKLVELVNAELTIANVPTCDPKISDAAGNLGQFDFETWSLDIGKPAFEAAAPTPAEKADMADTVYHESRHAEQWYRIAQYQASQGKSAQKITDDTDIPKKITDKAFADPLKKGSMEALIARGWNESVYGSQSAHREKVLTELSESGKALKKAQAAFDKDPTPANQAKLEATKARRAKALEAYFDLPEENDANRIGARVTKAYLVKEAEAAGVAP